MTKRPCPVGAVAARDPERLAVWTETARWTYADLDARACAFAAGLAARGLGRGDRLAVYRPDDPDAIALLVAAWRRGITVVPLSMRWPAATAAEVLERTGTRRLVAEPDAAWTGFDLIGLGDLAVEEAEGGEPVWNPEALATAVFTSGSTGPPKAAAHTLANHLWSARGLADVVPLAPDGRWLLALPLYHVSGLGVVVRCLLAGAAVALVSPGAPPAEAVRASGATHASLVSTQFLRLLEAPDPPPLRALLLGGSALPPPALAAAHARGLPVLASYGLTEMASTVTVTPLGAGVDVLTGTSGRVLPHRGVRVSGEGEVLVGGRTRFAGWLTAAGVRPDHDAEGFYATGDLGEWVPGNAGERYLRVLGRRDGRFVSGGENVQAEAVERALVSLAGVTQAVVVPVPDATFGHRAVAFVVAAPGTDFAALPDRLTALPRFARPIRVWALPGGYTRGLKPDRAALARLAASRIEEG